MNTQAPRVVVDLTCPLHQDGRKVEFAVNVFRKAERHGLEVAACSEFQDSVTCDKHCIHTTEAHHVHDQEAQKHREELSMIGRNVIG